MTGSVNYRNEAIFTLRVRGPAGVEQSLLTIVDTGFTGFLTLPPAVVSRLGLTGRGPQQVTLAANLGRSLNVYNAEVLWDGVWITTYAIEAAGVSLVGTAMLAGHKLEVEFVTGGAVETRPLP